MKQISIKHDIYLYLFSLLISLIVFYTLMINQSYRVGLNEAAKYTFLYEISAIEQAYLESGELPKINNSKTFQVYTNLDQLPADYAKHFDWNSFQEDVIYEAYLMKTPQNAAQYLYATYHRIKNSSQVLYVISQYDEDIYFNLLEQEPPQSVNQFNTILGGILILLVFVIVRILIYRITRPVLALAEWAETLDLSNRSKIEHLRYRELNTLSSQLIISIEKQREVIEREEFFLRTASHELRTPIAVISASSEMLERVKSELPNSSQRAVNRISRSIVTMQELITTLLWLAREHKEKLDTTNIQLTPLIQTVIDEHNYLIKDKELDINISIEKGDVLANKVEILVRIVVMNLIRNAIQHTDTGQINIVLTPTSIEISNPTTLNQPQEYEDINNTSYGLGLFLVEKICQKQNWKFVHRQEQSHFFVNINFKCAVN